MLAEEKSASASALCELRQGQVETASAGAAWMSPMAAQQWGPRLLIAMSVLAECFPPDEAATDVDEDEDGDYDKLRNGNPTPAQQQLGRGQSHKQSHGCKNRITLTAQMPHDGEVPAARAVLERTVFRVCVMCSKLRFDVDVEGDLDGSDNGCSGSTTKQALSISEFPDPRGLNKNSNAGHGLCCLKRVC